MPGDQNAWERRAGEGFWELSLNPLGKRDRGKAGRRSSDAGPASVMGDLCLGNVEVQLVAC